MARIPITGGFQLMPEGEHILKIIKAEYDEDFGKLVFTLTNAKGMTCQERFSLLQQDGSPNDRAMSAFSFFAQTAMNNFDMADVDPDELVGRYLRAEVIHNKVPSSSDPTKMRTFVNLGQKAPADGFEGEAATPAAAPALDLKALLKR